jgi:hypothetical protein
VFQLDRAFCLAAVAHVTQGARLMKTWWLK